MSFGRSLFEPEPAAAEADEKHVLVRPLRQFLDPDQLAVDVDVVAAAQFVPGQETQARVERTTAAEVHRRLPDRAKARARDGRAARVENLDQRVERRAEPLRGHLRHQRLALCHRHAKQVGVGAPAGGRLIRPLTVTGADSGCAVARVLLPSISRTSR